MAYATLMVHLELGQSNAGLLKIAGTIAEHFDSRVIGIAACQPMQIVYGDGYVSGELIQQDRDDLERESKKAEEEFRAALQTGVNGLEWRSTIMFDSISHFLAQEGRGADLVLTGVASGNFLDASRRLNTGDLIMQLGRPVLVVPDRVDELNLENIVIAWKDTREARRAVADALPFLKKASHVAIVAIAAKDELEAVGNNLEDVARWLKQHGVFATHSATAAIGDDAAHLSTLAKGHRADMIVAGAYGHSRVREWAFGGVTHDLLLCAERCSLVSH